MVLLVVLGMDASTYSTSVISQSTNFCTYVRTRHAQKSDAVAFDYKAETTDLCPELVSPTLPVSDLCYPLKPLCTVHVRTSCNMPVYVSSSSLAQDMLEFKPKYRPMTFELSGGVSSRDVAYHNPEVLIGENTTVDSVISLLCHTW